jgi:hypothetical protein
MVATSVKSAALFPLTPSLSLGERENRGPSLGRTGRAGLFVMRMEPFPLPKGEG